LGKGAPMTSRQSNAGAEPDRATLRCSQAPIPFYPRNKSGTNNPVTSPVLADRVDGEFSV
jgi:hypothetical protein